MHPPPLNIQPPDLEQAIERRILSVSPNMALSEVMEQMSQNRTSCALVVKADQLVGIFTEHDIVRLTASGDNLSEMGIAEVMTQNVKTHIHSESQNLFTALSLLKQHCIRHLPIIDQQGLLLGIVTPASIRRILNPVNLLKWRRVADVMTTQVIHAPPATSVLRLTQLMAEHQVSCVVIVEERAGEGNQQARNDGRGESESKSPPSLLIPVGIVTERDIVRYQTLGLDLEQTQVQVVMSAPLVPVHPEDSLWTVNQEMQRRNIRRFVIMGQQGQLKGIITQTSLLRTLDITEMYGTIGALQQLVEQRTVELSQTNQSLQNEVAERKRAEAALLESQERYALAVKGSGEGVWDWNILTNALYLAPRFKQIMGYEDHELPNDFDAWETRLHPEDRERVHAAVQNHLSHKTPYDLEYRIRTKRRDYCWVRTRAQAIWDDAGNPTRMAGSISDISARKQAEVELTQANLQLQQEITERQQIATSLKYQAKLEKLITDISNQFINLDADAVDQGIETALHALSEFMQADRGHVVLSSDQCDPYQHQCTYAWCAPDIEPTQMNLQAGLLGTEAPWMDQQLQQFGVARITSLDDLPSEAKVEKSPMQG